MLTLTIKTDNAAFGDTDAETGAEVARILRELADRIAPGDAAGYEIPLRDVNGNRVGRAYLDEREA